MWRIGTWFKKKDRIDALGNRLKEAEARSEQAHKGFTASMRNLESLIKDLSRGDGHESKP